MALPQQGTETDLSSISVTITKYCVNGLTPTGDGNVMFIETLSGDFYRSVNGLTPTGDGNFDSI